MYNYLVYNYVDVFFFGIAKFIRILKLQNIYFLFYLKVSEVILKSQIDSFKTNEKSNQRL